ncbi:DUF4034 domain-containing protein [Candidatus Margulisiibacteriota bacterium]
MKKHLSLILILVIFSAWYFYSFVFKYNVNIFFVDLYNSLVSPQSKITLPLKLDPEPAAITMFMKKDLIESDSVKIRKLLENEEYDKLTEFYKSKLEDFRKDYAKENDFFVAAEHFNVTSKSYEKLLSNWIGNSLDSFAPFLARGIYYTAQGWIARGTAWSKDTSKEQFINMRKYFQLAKQDLKDAIELEPTALPAYKTLISIAMAEGNTKVKKEVTQAALEYFPASYEIRSNYMYSLKPRWGGSYEEMNAYATECEKLIDKNPRLKSIRCYIYLDKADYYTRKGQFKEAIAELDKAVEISPKGIAQLLERGNIYLDIGKVKLAYDDFNRAILLKPTTSSPFLSRHQVYFTNENYELSMKDIEYAEKLEPNNPKTARVRRRASQKLVVKAYNIFKKSKSPDALIFFDLAIKYDNTNYEAHYWRGLTNLDLKKNKTALADFKNAIKYNPKHFESYKNIDWILFQQRKFDEIVKYWDIFIEHDPGHPEAYHERAGAYYHLGNHEAALRDAKKSTDLGSEEGKKKYFDLLKKIRKK